MGLPASRANGPIASPPRYTEGHAFDSGDEYPSDDELDDTDLKLLNTDYKLERDFIFDFPRHPSSPSIPPSLRHTDNTDPFPEKYRAGTYDAANAQRPLPLRNSSLHGKGMHNGSIDYRLNDAQAYQSYRQRRPLVDLIRNEWQYTTNSSPSSPGYSKPSWVRVVTAPRFRRYLYVLLILLTLVWGPWHYWGESRWTEHRLLTESLNERMRTGNGWFGINLRPEFMDMVQVKTLSTGLVPAGKGDKRRLIIVGDVHGCNDERRYPIVIYIRSCNNGIRADVELQSRQSPLRSSI